jgi:hypothetical protein
MTAPIRRIIRDVCRILLGAVFLFAVASKLTQFEILPVGPASGVRVFAYVLERNGIFPPEYSFPAAMIVVALEATVGIWLLSGRHVVASSVAAGALLVSFTGYLVFALLHQGMAPCNCFGTLQPVDIRLAVARKWASWS